MTDENRIIVNPPRRLLLTGDRKVGIVMVLIANGGAKTTYIGLDTIKEYADKKGEDPEETFAEILRVLYYISRISDSDDPDMSKDEKERLGTHAGKDVVLAEAAKVKQDFLNGQKFCMTDFSFLTTPGKGDIEIGRLSYFTGLLEATLKQMADTPPANLPDWDIGPVLKGEMFVYRGLIMYDLRDGKFATITVAYNSFTNVKPDGTTREMGLPH